MQFGYMGKILRINLTSKKIKTQDLPLSPENKLIFTVVPATGTVVPTSSKVGLFLKSPLTGIYAESYSSGQIAPRIKWAGYDVMIIEGEIKKSLSRKDDTLPSIFFSKAFSKGPSAQ
ncbi:MAG: aldehyde ferredoxin oxidoreductase N-terminal domain-containing protein [Candidatus Bathyarchaeia archaeon]